ncbi:(d)CMP kinase [Clostridium rectalis]|uniref:(d)CMP kinase n=1 Tax=Clostridium rectalis TaxID=2040295 RepID=UPI000F638A1F|nr:(d)CMP kinase [Clostridium rectalis]
MRIAVAIDGPAGAGKSTIAKLIGEKFNLMYIDTGAMYRAVALMAKRNGISEKEVEKLSSLVKSLNMKFINNKLFVNGEDVSKKIREVKISNIVSLYATVSEVRSLLVSLQQSMSQKYNVIMDGRDIGTVVLIDAPFKFYLVASPEVRARRRFNELKNKDIEVSYESILKDIKKRDYIDSTREVTPLRKAEDAIEINTSNLTIEEVVNEISNHIYKKVN